MTRREAREQAFCLLFQQTVAGDLIDDILQAAHEARDLAPDSFTEGLCYGVEENRERIDELIGANLRGWNIRRVSKVALTLLRIAVYEMLYEEDIPASVSINEAVELCKTYGGKGDAPYVNGVLGSIARAHCPEDRPAADREPQKPEEPIAVEAEVQP